jgi:hypothetical protein
MLTFTIPAVPTLTAMISPQYRSLHHERHHPPSASRLPSPCLALSFAALIAAFWARPCDSACAWSAKLFFSGPPVGPREVAENVWVGVPSAIVWGREKYVGVDEVGRLSTSMSCRSCQVVSADWSMHS